jgi:hypothetical protein
MRTDFIRESSSFSSPYTIFINEFTEEERNEVLQTLQPCNATVMYSSNLIMVTCKDEATFNWLSLKWQ